MGGKAHGTRRLQTAEWLLVVEQLTRAFNNKNVDMVAARPDPEKIDHGDVDVAILIDSVVGIGNLFKEIGLSKGVNNSYLFRTTTTTSSPADFTCQVDCAIVTNRIDLALWQFLYNFGDVGMVVGSYAKQIGFKLSLADGLTFVDPQRPAVKITVTKSVPRICAYLDLNYTRWAEGFSSRDSLIEWLGPVAAHAKVLEHSKQDRPLIKAIAAATNFGTQNKVVDATQRMKMHHDWSLYEKAVEKYNKEQAYKAIVNGHRIRAHLESVQTLISQAQHDQRLFGSIVQRLHEKFAKNQDAVTDTSFKETLHSVCLELVENQKTILQLR